MTASPTAPAAMPSEDDIADAIQRYIPTFHGAKEAATAILALFAPILAEKEQEIAKREPTAFASELGRKLALLADRAEAAEARDLAAESALAAEWERCIAIVDAQVPDWVKERSGPYWEGYRDAMEDAAEDMRKGPQPHAAAIRAQGE